MNKFSRFTNKCLSIGGERYVQMLNGKECLKKRGGKKFQILGGEI
jgi:hypothetical protein